MVACIQSQSVLRLQVDITVNNILAIVNTKLLKDYGAIDERLLQLVFVVKLWAKRRQVNDSYRGTLSSYCYVLMCIHLLQQRSPPILPCLQAMDPTHTRCLPAPLCAVAALACHSCLQSPKSPQGGQLCQAMEECLQLLHVSQLCSLLQCFNSGLLQTCRTVGQWNCDYFDDVESLSGFGSANKEGLAELVWSFFEYWAWRHDYNNSVVSVRTGGFLTKSHKEWTRRVGNERHLVCIEVSTLVKAAVFVSLYTCHMLLLWQRGHCLQDCTLNIVSVLATTGCSVVVCTAAIQWHMLHIDAGNVVSCQLTLKLTPDAGDSFGFLSEVWSQREVAVSKGVCAMYRIPLR